MQQHLKLAILSGAVVAAMFLGGCGNKGPLYIPEKPAEPQSAPESAQ